MLSNARKISSIALATTAIALAAPSAVTAQAARTPERVTRPVVNPPPTVDIQPLIDIRQPEASRSRSGRSAVGGYVRFIIERARLRPQEEIIYPSRNWVSRFFVGRNVSRALTARIAVTGANPIASTVTLASTAQNSNRRNGENFSSELTERRLLTPFIRVDPGAALTIEVRMLASQRADADITRNFFSLIERATRLVSPTSSLVTTLTSSRLTDASTFVDNSISQLFSESVTEDARLDVPVAEWNNPSTRSGGGLATISAIFPIGRNVRSEVNFRNIGAWTISVSDPIVSVFSHEPVGTAFGVAAQRVSETLTPEQVLAFPIDETVTLGEIMRGDGGVSAALLRADPDGTNADAVVREICARVSERARDLGLNQYDTAAALWAVSWSGMLSPNVARDLWAGPARDQQGSYICETIRIAVEYGLRRPQAADGTTLLTTSAAADIRDAAAAQERTIAELNRQIEALTPPPPAGRAVTDAAVIPDIATAPRPGESITAEEPEQ